MTVQLHFTYYDTDALIIYRYTVEKWYMYSNFSPYDSAGYLCQYIMVINRQWQWHWWICRILIYINQYGSNTVKCNILSENSFLCEIWRLMLIYYDYKQTMTVTLVNVWNIDIIQQCGLNLKWIKSFSECKLWVLSIQSLEEILTCILERTTFLQ